MRGLRVTLLLAAAVLSAAASAGVVTSPAPDRVAVTLYRDPQRSPDQLFNLNWLNGFALVSETRTVRLPAGDSDIRFEGVAGNILPQSAIVTGLPDGGVEKNRDAYLLSAASLVEQSLGHRVHLRRTSRATGAVTEQEAVIRSGKDGALVLQTGAGFEALRCTGLAETIVYDRVPEGLSARPTLSVRTRASQPVETTVTLSYLASGFDWQADYVATLDPARRRIDLFAWLTLANGDETSFRGASTQAVAGRVNHEVQRRYRNDHGALQLSCWPSATTSDIPLEGLTQGQFDGAEDIVVTGMRVSAPPPPPPPPAPMAEKTMMATQEELGDLKLYRIPEPVTVASNSQKQVAFLERRAIPADIIYRQRVVGRSGNPWLPAGRVLIMRNTQAAKLGVPLPAGKLVLFAAGRERPLLLGEGPLGDKAVGEKIEVEVGPAAGVHTLLVQQPDESWVLTATNDQPTPVAFEAELTSQKVSTSIKLDKRNGMPLWRVRLPANGTAILRYRVLD